MGSGDLFTRDTLTPRLRGLESEVDDIITAVFEYFATRAESEMRQNAPWQDQTANARNGLKVKAVHIPNVRHTLVLYHSMPYGLWLEVRWSGRYAIIAPTMQTTAPELASLLATALQRLGK
jgi:hypothetical protein